ncbi:MAG TPA: aminotransferase class IV [Bacillales bacterium]|nr:aminotransferase class IV [Bacillales bacterium]
MYRKTTYRSEQVGEVFDVLLWNEQGELTEFTNGNLVLKLEGKLWTPARESGHLNGTFCDELLSNGVIQERILTKKDLDNGSAMWLINSVRGWVKVYKN